MSSPESERELWLSASLDGELNAQEQAQLEQWLREDPAFAKRRDALSEQRAELRQVFTAVRGKKLDHDFADRVIRAAIAQAEATGLDSSHPLIRLARSENADTWVEAGGGSVARPRWRRAGVAVALAASLLLTLFFTRGSVEGPLGSDTSRPIAQNVLPETAPVDPVAGGESVAANGGLGLLAVPEPSAVAANRSAQPAGPMTDAPSRAVEPSPGVGEAIAVASPGVSPSPRGPEAGRVKPAVANPLKAVMVVAIEMTPEGQASMALIEALRAEKIRIAADGLLPSDVISKLAGADMIRLTQEGDGGKLYFVQASSLQLDRFVTRLMDDQQSFATFGLGIATDPQVLASVNALAVEPISSDPAVGGNAPERGESNAAEKGGDGSDAFARDLVSANGQPLRIEQGQAFVPVDRGTGLAGLLTPSQPSPQADDFRSQVLLLVR